MELPPASALPRVRRSGGEAPCPSPGGGGAHRAAPTGSPAVVFVGLLLLLLPVPSLTSQEPYWYEPPCQRDFFWTTSSGRTQESQFLDVGDDVTDQGVRYCQNPLAALPDASDEARYPPPVENVRLSYYMTEFKYSDPDYGSWAGLYSALNMSFELGPRAAGKVTGVLFSMEGLSADFTLDYRVVFCRAYRFVPPLTLDALIGPSNSSLRLFFDCFRGQHPGMLYEYTLRTLPLADTSGADPHDTVVKLRYRTPSCYSVPDDSACKQSSFQPPADIALCSHWKPQFFTVTPRYRHLAVVMELGPGDCGFGAFRMAVRSPQDATSGHWGSDIIHIYAGNSSKYETFAYGRNITYVRIDFADVPVGPRLVMVTPTPSPNSCFKDDGSPSPCSVTLSAVVDVIENPCAAHPCSSLEVCEPHGKDFVCTCKPGYIREGYVCIKNPCEPGGNASAGPCQPGSCILTGPGTYRCNCSQGFVFNEGSCTVDLCAPNPCGNGTCLHLVSPSGRWEYSCRCPPGFLGQGKACQVDRCLSEPCGPHGTCVYTGPSPAHSQAQGPFICECAVGYRFDASALSCHVSTGTLVAVVLASLLLAVLLLLLLVWRRRQALPHTLWLCRAVRCWSGGGSQSDVQHMSMPSKDSIQPCVDAPAAVTATIGCSQEDDTEKEMLQLVQRVTVLLLHTHGDHPLHDNAVEKLAIFLQECCMCDVIFPPWCWMDIQRIGLTRWLSQALHSVPRVIVLCSRGTWAHWQAPSPEDVLGQALPLILADAAHPLAGSDKYAVAHLDYSARQRVPPPLCAGAVFRLMRHADALFFRLHGLQRDSAGARLRARDLEEGRYAAASPQGAELRAALQLMHRFQREEPDWYDRYHDASPTRAGRTDPARPSPPPRAAALSTEPIRRPVDDKEFNSALSEFLNTPVKV